MALPQPTEIDLSASIKARYTVMCDACNKELNTNVSYDARPDVWTLSIDEKDENGCCCYHTYHFCSDACAIKHIQNREEE